MQLPQNHFLFKNGKDFSEILRPIFGDFWPKFDFWEVRR